MSARPLNRNVAISQVVSCLVSPKSQACCVFRPEVKWAKVNDIEGHAIYPMKRYAHEALLKDIFAFDIKLDGSVGKCNVGQIRDAIPQDFTETNPFFRSVAEAA